ncbi:beta/gamma crystallin-related protein [Phenylobacterium sp.]|uniref:beta/gamma crystallin-related protein n=1 Tax=Phenylobacterium sp. TaxID=1871053 RepID=UPI0035B3FAD4
MPKLRLIAAIAGAAGCLAASASAQQYDRDRGPMATLYEGYNYQGRSVDIYGGESNLAGMRFNDKARSARFRGDWRVCEDAGFGGRCQQVRGDVPDLGRIGMAERISSLQPDTGYGGGSGGGYNPGRPPGGGGQARPTEGFRSVFFPYPTYNGRDIATGNNAADAFCRSQGLGQALYLDSSQRAAQAVDAQGRYVANTNVLRDVLCRRY